MRFASLIARLSTRGTRAVEYKHQDAPDVCSVKLRHELIANANHPSHTNFTISDAELVDYKAGHSPKTSNHLYEAKPRDEY